MAMDAGRATLPNGYSSDSVCLTYGATVHNVPSTEDSNIAPNPKYDKSLVSRTSGSTGLHVLLIHEATAVQWNRWPNNALSS
jgi:hypothetical protein